ncbi:Por secretion system C-terminal sorting domain-containing protein [Hymenobacter daecheongensis DSM 21074]|uniref:Por secretion system C-terminal sorting domain-containing protein n=1 Tax=Hymenobacter daecheongensis DSM 21074 TaxID=1121955 RepID=A0A1M6GKJ1_9BACT|nr:FG-GAP-like repeat-containing protein [Hymenobacter daecheongensis]SHJ10467.1 Por secretion system C-terminal sorting domain-containing protein [Hymenobacter daecheongensis DSM 21074]
MKHGLLALFSLLLVGLTAPSRAQNPVSLTTVAPASGPAGTTITLTGSGFAATAAQNAVFVGRVRATLTAASATQLSATVPAGARSPSIITVINTATGRQASTAAFRLTFAGALNTATYQRTDYPAASNVNDVAGADVNADGLVDILTASGAAATGGSSVTLLLNGAAGQFQPPIQLLGGFLPSQLEVADLNSDGRPDLVVGNAGSLDISVLLGSAGGGFASAQNPDLGGLRLADGTTGLRTLRVADADNDGLPDIVFISKVNIASNSGPLQWLRNTGSGFQLQPAPGGPNTNEALAVGDFNQDGLTDLLGINSSGLTVLLRNAANTGFNAPETTALSLIQYRLAVADFDDDGRTDVLILRSASSSQGGYDLLLYERAASGTAFQGVQIFSSQLATSGSINRSLTAADADGDGRLDILVTDGARLSVWRNVGGSFNQPVSFANPSGTRQALAGDFDGDGRTDIVTTTATNDLLSLYRYNPAANPNQNNPPTLNALADLTLSEDAGPQTVALSGISNGGDAGQSVTLTVRSSDPALIPPPTISYFSPTTTGTLRFQPAPDAFGTCTITVTASDGQPQNGTISRTFTVSIAPLNDAPTLDAVPDVIITQAATSQIAVALSGITSGAANENQTLTLAASVSLAGGGAISNGSFTYTSPATTGQYVLPVAALQPGLYATVTLTVNDGQAISNSFSRTFRIFYQPGSAAGPPTLDPIADRTADRSLTSQLPVPLTGITDGDPGQTLPLTVTAVSSDAGLVAVGPVSYTSPASTGSLPYTISATRGGTVVISLTVSNGQSTNGTITRTFRVTVPPVLSTATAAGQLPATWLQLYPNPAPAGRFWLEAPAAGPADVTVADLAGRVVWQQWVASLQKPQLLQLPAGPAGVYVVKVRTAEGVAIRRVLVE